jgi:hypothetical protein
MIVDSHTVVKLIEASCAQWRDRWGQGIPNCFKKLDTLLKQDNTAKEREGIQNKFSISTSAEEKFSKNVDFCCIWVEGSDLKAQIFLSLKQGRAWFGDPLTYRLTLVDHRTSIPNIPMREHVKPFP